MPTLSYSGRIKVATTANGQLPTESAERMHTLLDKALSAYEDDVVNLKTATVVFDEQPIIEIEVGSREADLADLQPVREQLADAVVEIGMEDDAADAAEKVRID